MRDIKTRAPPDCDIVLCGNKSDLDSDRVVTTEEGRQLADEYGVQFFESSALTGANVEDMFTNLATTIKHRRIDEYEGSGEFRSSNIYGENACLFTTFFLMMKLLQLDKHSQTNQRAYCGVKHGQSISR